MTTYLALHRVLPVRSSQPGWNQDRAPRNRRNRRLRRSQPLPRGAGEHHDPRSVGEVERHRRRKAQRLGRPRPDAISIPSHRFAQQPSMVALGPRTVKLPADPPNPQDTLLDRRRLFLGIGTLCIGSHFSKLHSMSKTAAGTVESGKPTSPPSGGLSLCYIDGGPDCSCTSASHGGVVSSATASMPYLY